MEDLPINDPVEIGEKYSSPLPWRPGFMDVYEKASGENRLNSDQNRLNLESNINQKIKESSFNRDSIILVFIVIVGTIFLLTCEKHWSHLGIALLSMAFRPTSIAKTIVKVTKARFLEGG